MSEAARARSAPDVEPAYKLFYTTTEVAKMFGVTTTTVRKWVKQDKLEVIRINGHLRVHHHSLEKLANYKWGNKPA